MKKYTRLTIYDVEGMQVFDGSYSQLLSRFYNNANDANDFIEECKENGCEYTSRTCYYDFEYDNPNTTLSDNWLNDISEDICYENDNELVEQIILKSFKAIKNAKCCSIGKYMCVVLPKKYDSLVLRQPKELDRNFFKVLLKHVYENINNKHNRTASPKIRVAEFVPEWRTKTKYADYNEGYTFYYNAMPQEDTIDKLLR